ncbi:MAG TPA: sigma-70 family RNA polymerase sigma factor [Pyrinomonadaceae bacterium]|nr:sigma-70 family RNA polymerase sigma factor [Pyrinomonadaceae bacterium]
MTDEKLLQRAGRGDETAFLLLYERHRAPVFRFAYRMLGGVELAEDVTHDCFLDLMKNPQRFDPARSALRTYLFAAARNLAYKHFRQPFNDGAATLDITDVRDELRLPAREEPLGKLLDAELSFEVRKAIASLPPLQREAVVLFEFEELTLQEVAEIVGADTGTVKSRLFRAREGLRRSLAAYFKSEPEIAIASEKIYK